MVDFRLSARRNVAAAKAFFRKAIKRQQRCPQTITLDGYAASHRAVRELKAAGSLPANTKLRSSKYLNNLIEQDHRSVKQRIAVMLGFKEFSNAAITITGIELLQSMAIASGRSAVAFRTEPRPWSVDLFETGSAQSTATGHKEPTSALTANRRRNATEQDSPYPCGTPALRKPSRRRSPVSPADVMFSLNQASERSGRSRSRAGSASAAVSLSPCSDAAATSK